MRVLLFTCAWYLVILEKIGNCSVSWNPPRPIDTDPVFTQVRIANGDTYHVTNCSPQVAGFNQSSQGEDNWGDLENHVLKSAVQERYCHFAGPILDPRDDTFIGRAGGRATAGCIA